ncbi:MAG: SRPBCC family protein [Thermoleophilia bacterium]|nr:SRPBCC family protein [Thermoleophilia bacterium]
MAEQNGGVETDGSSVLDALKSKELLLPAALSAVGAVAVSKGPDLVRRLTDASERKGEDGAARLGRKAAEGAASGLQGGQGLLGKLASKAIPGGGGGQKKTRRLPVQRWTDVAVPVAKAYDEWTNFDEFPKFMHRVRDVHREGDNEVRWQEKIWFSTREWEGRITDRRKNDRIAWQTTSGMSHYGVVTFHRLDENLTRVMVDMEFEPNGVLEKMASGLRFVKRAVEADLARFKAHVEMKDAKGIDYRPAAYRPDPEREGARRERESGRKERRQSAGSRS